MPVPSFIIFERLYRFFASRRKLLFAATLLVVALSILAAARMHIQEDIVAMLPDDSSSVAEDFRLLQLAPFTRKLVITLKTERADEPALIAVADRLAQELQDEKVGKVTTGPSNLGGGFFAGLGAALPSLASDADLLRLAAVTTPIAVHSRLQDDYEQLLSPEGWALKGRIQNDPLAFSALALEKLGYLNLIPNMRLVQNHFVSADGKSGSSS